MILVLFSSGIDSTTALYQAVAEHGAESVLAFHVSYGAKHNRREEYLAWHLAHRLGCRWKHVQKWDAFKGVASSLLCFGQGLMSGVDTVVPGRNRLLMEEAAKEKPDAIVFAAHLGDAAIYEDCRPAFVEQMQAELGIHIHAPFLQMDKPDVVTLGESLGVLWAWTWSCYQPDHEGLHCGECGACAERRRGFWEAGVVDPTEYAA